MKNLLALISVLFATITGLTQSKKASWGAKAGINFSNAINIRNDINEGRTGINAGVFTDYSISTNFSIQSELNFSQIGWKEGEGTSESKFRLNYLALPILAKYGIANSGFSIYAGPQISMLINIRQTQNGNTTDPNNDGGIFGFYKAEFSGIVGSEFNIPQTNFLISARYQFGLSDIENVDDVKPIKLNAATFTVGYRF